MARTKKSLSQAPLFVQEAVVVRFLIMIDPGPTIAQEVMGLRERLHAGIGAFTGAATLPHLTLCLADLPYEYIRDVSEGVSIGCLGQRPFDLRFEGIRHFDDKRTIYIDPVQKAPIAALRKSVADHVCGFQRVKRLGVRLTEHPHLTLAAGLKPQQFEAAWALLAPHTYKGAVRVNEVKLLARELTPGSVYQHVRTFALR